MIQVQHPTRKITIELQCYDDIPNEGRYVAWIKEPEYKGIVEQGESAGDCVKKIGVSLHVLELYRKNSVGLPQQ